MDHHMPRPGPEHERLAALDGTWEGDEQLAPSLWGPGGQARGRLVNRRDLDGFFLVQDYVQEKDGRVMYRGHGVLGYDPGAKAYTWYWVDSMGSPSQPMSGTWDRDALRFESASPRGDGRYEFRVDGRGRLEFRIDRRFAGGDWQNFLTGTYARR
jgi:Protein of unknown function (DUF1579)